MNKTAAVLLAGAFALAPMLALADDRTPCDDTPAEEAKMRQEADTMRLAFAKMTPDEQTAARTGSDARHQKYLDTILKITQDPRETRNMGINRSAAASKAGPMPQRDWIDTPEAEKLALQEKGQ